MPGVSHARQQEPRLWVGPVVTGLGRTRPHLARFSGCLPAFAEGIAAQCLHPAGAAVSFSTPGSGVIPSLDTCSVRQPLGLSEAPGRCASWCPSCTDWP